MRGRRSLPAVLTGGPYRRSLPAAVAARLLAVLIITTRLPTLASNYGSVIIYICVIIIVIVVVVFRRHILCGKICRAGIHRHRHIYRRCYSRSLLGCKRAHSFYSIE
jgi:hypothetical protein